MQNDDFEMQSTIMELKEEILGISPVEGKKHCYYAITKQRKVIEIHTELQSCSEKVSLGNDDGLLFDQEFSIQIAANNNIIALYNTYGKFGIIVDLSCRQVIMRFNRDDYHYVESKFPVAFFQHGDRTLLIHGTEWNRLDISDPLTGERLTARELPEYQAGRKERDPRDLDFFHGQLLVSTDQEWVVDNGWIWHPTGAITKWNLSRWVNDNIWESEDGSSYGTLWWGKENWNEPICWVGATEIGMLGNEDIDFWDEDLGEYLSGYRFRICKVCDGSVVKDFPIIKGELFFDQYLFSFTNDAAMHVYDVETGRLLYAKQGVGAKAYHSGCKEFLDVRKDRIILNKFRTQ